MSPPDAVLLVSVITVVAVLLMPLASKLVGDLGREISRDVDGGRTGADLNRHLDRTYEVRSGGGGAVRDEEIRQLLEARAFVRGEAAPAPADLEAELQRLLHEPAPSAFDPGLADEIRQLVIANNGRRERAGKPLLDVEAEVTRRLDALRGG